MILGTGIDIIETARIGASLQRFGERFLHRILTRSEIDYSLSFAKPDPHIAARFAAKEAVSKAFGTGIGKHIGWLDIEVCNRDSGEPYVVLHAKGATLLRSRGGGRLHISLSHTDHYASAVAILEAGESGGFT